MKVRFSPAAQADLIDIAIFIAHDNPARALMFVQAARDIDVADFQSNDPAET